MGMSANKNNDDWLTPSPKASGHRRELEAALFQLRLAVGHVARALPAFLQEGGLTRDQAADIDVVWAEVSAGVEELLEAVEEQ